MASVKPTESIIEESNTKRVFYFHEFAYFVNTLDYTHRLTDNTLKSYFVALLLVFDEILIPLEHITISCSHEEAHFKKSFLNSLFAKDLISAHRLVTTRWSVCSNTPEHIEACDKYMHSFDAGSFHFIPSRWDAVMEMRVFKRDQATQSLETRDYAEISLGQKDRDVLRYDDGAVIIEFSVENAILGKARDKLSDPKAQRIAECAYVRAMTVGNGNIYRAAVEYIESVRHGESVLFDPLIPLAECQGVNPVLLNSKFLQQVLWHVGYRVPKMGREMAICEDWRWMQGFLSYLNQSPVEKMKNTLIQVLQHISLCEIASDEDFQEALQTIRPMPVSAFLPRTIAFVLQPKKHLLDKFQVLAGGRQPVRHFFFDDTVLSVFNRSVQKGWQK